MFEKCAKKNASAIRKSKEEDKKKYKSKCKKRKCNVHQLRMQETTKKL